MGRSFFAVMDVATKVSASSNMNFFSIVFSLPVVKVFNLQVIGYERFVQIWD